VIYEPNTIQWPIGSAVIHDADRKTGAMLMRVIGYTREGLCRTRYLNNSGRWRRKILANDIRYLHDPKRFGLDVEAGR
jgi:hypothetical protein